MKRLLASLIICFVGASIYGESEADRLVYEGIDALKARDLDAAIANFSEALAKDPKNLAAYNNRGLAYKDKKEFDKSIADLTHALRLKSEWSAYYNRAVTYHEKGDQDRAVADVTKALRLKPKEPLQRADCLLLRAHAYFDKQEAQPALNDLDATIKLDQRRADAYVLRGILYKIRHHYDKSLHDYETAIGLDPTDARSYAVEAYLLSVCPMPKYRDAKKAIAYATKACELTQWKASDSLETLAAAYAEAGLFEEAIKRQQAAAAIDPRSVDHDRVELYRRSEPFRDLNREEKPISTLANIANRVSVNFGERVVAEFRLEGDRGVEPRKIRGELDKPNRVWLDFRQDKRGRVLFLAHSFARRMMARCLARLKDYDTYFETDILPVDLKTVSPEIWTEPIDELVLYDVRLTEAKGRSSREKQLSIDRSPWPKSAAARECR